MLKLKSKIIVPNNLVPITLLHVSCTVSRDKPLHLDQVGAVCGAPHMYVCTCVCVYVCTCVRVYLFFEAASSILKTEVSLTTALKA